MNYVDVFYQSDDGLQLYARDYPGPGRNAPAVLCLPGLTRNSKDFAQLADALSAKYRVICPDQRGRGRSARDTDAARYRPDRYAADMRTMLDVLGISQVALIGTSLGGLMTMLMLVTDAPRIRGAVINDIGPEVDPRGLARIASYVGKMAPARDWHEAVEQTRLTNGIAFPKHRDEDWQAMAQDLYVQRGATPVLDYDPAIADGLAATTASANLWPLFDGMPPKPLLIVRGEISDVLSAETIAEMARRAPQLTAVTVPDRGHAPTLTEPVALAAIEEFLGRLG